MAYCLKLSVFFILLLKYVSISSGFRYQLPFASTRNHGTLSRTSTKRRVVPVTLISGFLGGGKTSLVQHALQNKNGLEIGVVINDMASINIDSKLVRIGEKGASSKDIIEIQDGCVCCTMAEELLATIDRLVSAKNKETNSTYDHIIVESTGVSEPRSVRDQFQDVEEDSLLLHRESLEKVKLGNMVTVVDASTFLKLFETNEAINGRPDLISLQIPSSLDSGSVQRSVADLLLEQIECADVIILNKIDLIDKSRLASLHQFIQQLNPRAVIHDSEFSAVDIEHVVGNGPPHKIESSDDGKDVVGGMATLGIVDEHRLSKDRVRSSINSESNHNLHHDGHDHTHISSSLNSNSRTHADIKYGITSFVYESRRPFHPERLFDKIVRHLVPCYTVRSLEANLWKRELESIGEFKAIDIKADSYDETTDDKDVFIGPSSLKNEGRNVNIETRSHRKGIDYDSELSENRNEENIQNDEYQDVYANYSVHELANKIVRSKGFCWLASSHHDSFYWSHSLSNFNLAHLGCWWGSIKEDDWFPTTSLDNAINHISHSSNDSSGISLSSIDIAKEKALIKQDFDGRHADRRNELVFIGIDLDKNKGTVKHIKQLLDSALLNDEEFKQYEELVEREESLELKMLFKNPFRIRTKTGY